MTPKFLREEASRFRELAEGSTREASIQRLLGMAADFEARATAAEAAAVAKPEPEPQPEPEPPAPRAKPERKSTRTPIAVP